MMKSNDVIPATVDAYLDKLKPEVRAVLQQIREMVKEEAPEAIELISYQMPAFKLNGPLLYYAAFKAHCSLFPASKTVTEKFVRELSGYKTSAGTIQFTPERPLPVGLLRKIIRMRVKEQSK